MSKRTPVFEPIDFTVSERGRIITAAILAVIRQKKAALDAERAKAAQNDEKRDAA